MDAATVRTQLEEVRIALKRNEAEHEVLVSLMNGYEGWLRLNPSPQMELPLPADRKTKTRGKISFRGAVLTVLRDARGQPLNVREILVRARSLGAETGAKNPLGAVDLMCYSLARGHPVEKVGPRTWRYEPLHESGAI